MKYLIVFIMFIQLANADPFYGDNENDKYYLIHPNQSSLEKETNAINCDNYNYIRIVNLAVPFKDLELIGIVKINNILRALFIDNKSKIEEFRAGDWIQEQHITIEEINAKSINYIDWNSVQNCDFPNKKSINL